MTDQLDDFVLELGVQMVFRSAERFWSKMHSEGLCKHEDGAWAECEALEDALEWLKESEATR